MTNGSEKLTKSIFSHISHMMILETKFATKIGHFKLQFFQAYVPEYFYLNQENSFMTCGSPDRTNYV